MDSLPTKVLLATDGSPDAALAARAAADVCLGSVSEGIVHTAEFAVLVLHAARGPVLVHPVPLDEG